MAETRVFTQKEFEGYIERAALNGAIGAARDIATRIEMAAVGLFQAGADESAGALRDTAGDLRAGYLARKEADLLKLSATAAASERKEGILATTFDTNLAVETLD